MLTPSKGSCSIRSLTVRLAFGSDELFIRPLRLLTGLDFLHALRTGREAGLRSDCASRTS